MKYFILNILKKLNLISKKKKFYTSISDNQYYPQVCLDASINYRIFNKFRRNPFYNQILEHVTYEQGLRYYSIIKEDDDILNYVNVFKENDFYGNPRVYEYEDIGFISPTTLRYIKVLLDLKKLFKSLDKLDICEIGIGYGGQCRIINAYFKPNSYCLVDIQPALGLAKMYLDHYITKSVLEYRTMNELPTRKYDLLISNYAFSELPRHIQDVYLSKVILNSKRGYITYNRITPPEFKSYNPNELLELIPRSEIIPEEPLTHPKNCIIIWGNK